MALEAEKQMKLQTKMMQADFDNMKSTADTSGTVAADFLKAWGSSLNDVKSMYGDAASVINGLMTDKALSPKLKGLEEISGLMKKEYATYKEEYAPMEKEFMGAARDTMQEKRAIQREIAKGGGKWADQESAAGRAKADVGIQGELQNQAEARKLMASGIDPSSGRFGALTRKGAIDLAGQTVQAMNLARQTEKTEGLKRAISANEALNPTTYSEIGQGIRKGGMDLLTRAGEVEVAGVNAQSQHLQAMGNLGTSYGNLATGMAKSVTEPLAEMAGYYTGLGKNTGGGAVTNPMASYQAITKAPAVMQGSNELLGTQATEKKAKTQADWMAEQKAKRAGTYY